MSYGLTSPTRIFADCLVWYAFCALIEKPITAILSGTLWGPVAFVGGAIVVASIMFVSEYFKDEIDGLL